MPSFRRLSLIIIVKIVTSTEFYSLNRLLGTYRIMNGHIPDLITSLLPQDCKKIINHYSGSMDHSLNPNNLH